MTESIVLDPIKTKHRAMWALGDYDRRRHRGHRRARAACWSRPPVVSPASASSTSPPGPATRPCPAAPPAADVVASDLTPELLEIGRQRGASASGLDIELAGGRRRGTCRSTTATSTSCMSCVGVMFAPHHQPAADELVRVCRPGGRIAPGQLDARGLHRAAVRDHEAVRAAAAARRSAAAAVGRRGARARAVRRPGRPTSDGAARGAAASTGSRPAEEFRDFFKANYGPTIAAYRDIADDPERIAALDRALDDLADALRRRRRRAWSGSTCWSSRRSVADVGWPRVGEVVGWWHSRVVNRWCPPVGYSCGRVGKREPFTDSTKEVEIRQPRQLRASGARVHADPIAWVEDAA